MYFLYDVVWLLADPEEFNLLLEEGGTILWVDLCYCFLFAYYNLSFGNQLFRSALLKRFERKKVLVISLIFLLANTFMAFAVENFLDVALLDISDREVWGNAYLMGLISTVQSLIVAVEYYYKESEQKYAENRRLEMQLLKTQMNPHFVFNSLSILAGLISIDPRRAGGLCHPLLAHLPPHPETYRKRYRVAQRGLQLAGRLHGPAAVALQSHSTDG